MTPIKTAWDEAGDVRWTGADKARFDRAFRAWAKRTGNETAFEIRQERGEDHVRAVQAADPAQDSRRSREAGRD